MSDPSSRPTQPLTDAEVSQIRAYLENTDAYGPRSVGNHNMLCRLLAEVDRLRAELAAQAQKLEERTTQWRALLNLRDRDAQVFMAQRAAFDRLQSERNALVAKLGLDWGSDEFGDLNA